MANKQIISPTIVATVVRVLDLSVIALMGLASYYIRYPDLEPQIYDWSVITLVTFAAANAFHFFNLYDPHHITSNPYQFRRLLLASLSVVLVVLAIGYATKTSGLYSRTWMAVWASGGFALLCLVRIFLALLLWRWQRKGWIARRIAIVGAGPQGQQLIEHQSFRTDHGVSIVGIFDDRCSRIPTMVGKIAVRGSVDDLLNLVSKDGIDEVIVALPWSAENRLNQILAKLRSAPIDVRLCPEGVAFQFATSTYSSTWGVGMLNAYERPLKNWHYVIKSLEDRILASLILVTCAPLMATIALAIKWNSRGPVLFMQRRYGFSNELIEVYKFRTIHHDQTDSDGQKQVAKNDPRVTPVGAFLRRSGLDELPQLINVLKGEMSIVGPRPHPTQTKAGDQLFEDVVLEYFSRHRVKPGITGWAQVNGWKGKADTPEKIRRRVEYDLHYIDRWSLWLDLKIIIMTPGAMISSKGRD